MSAVVPGTHSALLYHSDEEWLASVGPFVSEGLTRGDHVLLMISPEQHDLLSRELGADMAGLEIGDPDVAYRPQARVLREVVGFLGRVQARTRLVAEQQLLAARTDLEVSDYLRIEAASNVLFERSTIDVLCPYDAVHLPGEVLDSCRRTHGHLLESGRSCASPAYVDPARFIAQHSFIPDPPASAVTFNCDSPQDLGTARGLVESHAAAHGLDVAATTGLLLGVTEILTNALEHGSAPRRLYVYREGPALACHVHDSGLGPADPLATYVPPDGDPRESRGIWLARQLCDAVEITTNLTGTHVRLLALVG
ncbi:MAG: sensor histidine kinase [Nocardioidaceae bacterium]|nr:sensor histidine kinase [Nocardioidaceae bacterium]